MNATQLEILQTVVKGDSFWIFSGVRKTDIAHDLADKKLCRVICLDNGVRVVIPLNATWDFAESRIKP